MISTVQTLAGSALRARSALVLAVLAFAMACAEAPSEPAEGEPMRVLLVGNSLLAFNDTPLLAQALADAARPGALDLHDRAVPGMTLRDHWESERTRTLLESGVRWDLVVLQERAIVSDSGRAYLIEYAGRFRMATSAPVSLLQVWPPRSEPEHFASIRASIAFAAATAGAEVVPAGEAWRVAQERDPDLALYAGDGIYPSLAGAYLTALVIVGTVLGEPVLGLPARLELRDGGRVELPSEVAALLQEVAREVAATRR